MDFYIPKQIFGFSQGGFNLEFDSLTQTFKKNIKTPLNSISISSEEMKNIDKIYHLDLYKNNILSFPQGEKWKNSYSVFNLNQKNIIPWFLCLPSESYKQEIKQYTTQLKLKLGNLNLEYYNSIFKKTDFLFKNLQPAKINLKKFVGYVNDDNIINKTFIKTFSPDLDGFANVPVYSKTNTKTGRLTIESGPNILLLQKNLRDVVYSRHGNKGKIVYLDFKSLEPRILLSSLYYYLLCGYLPRIVFKPDIYQAIIDELSLENKDIGRDVVKLVVLRKLFGTSDETLCKEIKPYIDSPMDLVQMISDLFMLQDLRQKLSQEFSINPYSHLNNFYGRPIVCEDGVSYKLINYFVQSTAVDVALLGFTKIVEWIVSNDKLDFISPLFVLHDALILDIRNDQEKHLVELMELGSTNIPKMEQVKFFIEKSEI